MSDGNLLAFGCVVSFIALAGAYVYFRECFMAGERPERQQSHTGEPAEPARDVA